MPCPWHSRRQPCSGSPQWPGAHSRHWSPPAPGRQWHCPVWGWHSEPLEAGPQAHGWQPPQPSKPKCPSCRHRCGHSPAQPSRPGCLHSFNHKFLPCSPRPPSRPEAPPPQTRGPAPPVPRPRPCTTRLAPPRQPYLTAVTARSCHTCLAQAVPAVGVTGLCPTRGAVAPCRRWAVK